MWGRRWSVIRSTDFILILEQNYKGSILEEAKSYTGTLGQNTTAMKLYYLC